jgi:hypothetical protein
MLFAITIFLKVQYIYPENNIESITNNFTEII